MAASLRSSAPFSSQCASRRRFLPATNRRRNPPPDLPQFQTRFETAVTTGYGGGCCESPPQIQTRFETAGSGRHRGERAASSGGRAWWTVGGGRRSSMSVRELKRWLRADGWGLVGRRGGVEQWRHLWKPRRATIAGRSGEEL